MSGLVSAFASLVDHSTIDGAIPDIAAKVRKLQRQQAALAHFGSFALRQLDMQNILSEAVRVCAEGLDVPFAKICRYRPESNDLLIVAGHGWRSGVLGRVEPADMSSPQGHAFSTGEPSFCSDLSAETHFNLPSFYAEHGIVSIVDVIIKGGDSRPYGILEIDNDRQHLYDQHDIDFLTGFANVVAEAVATASRAESLQYALDRLKIMVAEKDELLRAKNMVDQHLREAQKLDAIGQLTGGVAHDFNNILTVITGSIEILSDAVADRPQLATLVKLIEDAAARGADLTGRLLSFARKQPLQPREVDVNLFVGATTGLLKPTLGEQIQILVELSGEPVRALVDPGQLTNAILNLALNARDAMPNGGTLTIRTSNVVIDPGGADEATADNYVLIAVTDTGNGISEENLDKVFEPFFTTKEIDKGTGLGLSMVYGFVKQSLGHVTICSALGQGTTIGMYLPQANGVSLPVASSRMSPVEGGQETVLVVEDDPLVRTFVLTRINDLGYHTLPAANAAEAMIIIDGPQPIDLLFTDVVMPGAMNGRQLADAARERRPSLKVLFTSGYSEDAIIHNGYLDAGVLLLAKPYHKAELAAMLRSALELGDLLQPAPAEPVLLSRDGAAPSTTA
jgi:signal transduction histidine kinase/ActR/RegA family two-component response regulator